ncbi:hypothetical protein N7532_011763 [Penicillium argentinense]|uniref:Uncharacterized protein n=1 Tax=Penicillium argentinense TaxID=1131581 RepID=A0A9W9EJ74_9EURO|nr:uncharacterized protein N7532_011763 [Penicillium argentinense]KAJ5082720.1 hypothetical protein N7532_011763 [Penicillium argentinense]
MRKCITDSRTQWLGVWSRLAGSDSRSAVRPCDDGTGIEEVSVIPNDGFGYPETKEQIVSYMSIKSLDPWSTNYAGLAHSNDGNTFTKLEIKFKNKDDNSDPFQMWTMQRDGN